MMNILNKVKELLSNKESDTGYDFDRVIADTKLAYEKDNQRFWQVKLNTIELYKDEVRLWDDRQKVEFLLYCVKKDHQYYQNNKGYNYNSSDGKYRKSTIRNDYINQLLRSSLTMSSDDACRLIDAFCDYSKGEYSNIFSWPVGLLFKQITKQFKGQLLTKQMKDTLQKIHDKLNTHKYSYYEKEINNILSSVDTLLFYSENSVNAVKPVLFEGKDDFAIFANNSIAELKQTEKEAWYKLIEKAKKAKGGKPTNKYLKESAEAFKELGVPHFKKIVHTWFEFLYALKEKTTEHTQSFNGRVYTHRVIEFIAPLNTDIIKGFIWMCANFHDTTTIQLISNLAERSYRKIPGKGPASMGIGNACLFVLYKSKGLDGIGQLSRLKLRIKQANTQKMIENYLKEAAKERGISIHEIEDLAVDSFGLAEGKKEVEFQDYKAVLEITGVGKSTLTWLKPDGKIQKSLPAFVKEKHATKLKKLKQSKKQIEQTVSAQRDRLDRMFRQRRSWDKPTFMELLFDHGLLSTLTRKLIWTFTTNGQTFSALYLNGEWSDQKGKVHEVSENAVVTLWHPASATVSEIEQWRNLILEKEIRQPLKQAFREVYLLTDAEVNTKSYSNRMAAHVLKQHQFNMLAKTRGWKYALMGAYDDGRYNEAAELELSEFGLRAEYWINEVNVDDAYNDTGIWHYIATDQVRFINTTNNEVVDLADIPAIPFSEVLRDVDLFVGVASVGNDPTWNDSGGIPVYRDYWQSYSFGDLSEIAKNRKEILAKLLPRLKIAEVATIKDKFLVVKGKLRTYKIHIGSTNILMEPNDQYLCIVPDRSRKDHTQNLFIPFEGDSGLSVILSKAFLLTADDKITDSTITSQIKRR